MGKKKRRQKQRLPLFDHIDHFLRRTRRRINRSEWAIRRLRLSTSENTGTEPGILLIQIDGLSRRQMERALRRGLVRERVQSILDLKPI